MISGRYTDLLAVCSLFVGACSSGQHVAAPAALSPTDTGVVDLTGPILVAFFRPVTQAQVDSDPDLPTVLDDFLYSLGNDEKVFVRAGVRVHRRFARHFVLRTSTFSELMSPEDPGIGYYLAVPGRAPLILYGVRTDSDLLELAADYFKLPGLWPPSSATDTT